MRAAERGDQALARTLIQQGADVNAPGVDGSTPLHRAVFTDHLDVASLLVKAGAKVGATDRYGVTPLALAAQQGSATVLDLLLKAGVNPNDPINFVNSGETPVMLAARSSKVDAVATLVRAAVISAGSPAESTLSGLAPASISRRIIFALPLRAASASGVTP